MGDLASAQSAPPGTTYTVVPYALNSNFIHNAVPTPPPGTIAVNTGGLFQWMVGASGSSGQSFNGQKRANYGTVGFTRLWLGMDGQSSNGILYGTETQIRQNFGTPSGGDSSGTGSGGSTLYVRTASAYVATKQLGKIVVGATGGPATAFNLGMFEAFNEGGWNGDAPFFINGAPALSGSIPQYPYFDSGNLYTTDKISYFSPNFSGFDFGVSWEPSNVTLNDATACAAGTAAGSLSTCDNLSSSNVGSDGGKRRNMIDVGLRYRGAFGPVGVAVSGGYLGSGTVHDTAVAQHYLGMSVGHIGTEITIGGLMFGGHYDYGNENGLWYLQPTGGTHEQAYMAGAQYTIGPVVAGASFFNNWDQGDYTAPKTEGQRNQYGLAAGGYYALTSGLGFFLSYLYGERKQSGYDFLAGTAGTAHNKVHAQVAGLGISLQW
jgi:hypothetical protein